MRELRSSQPSPSDKWFVFYTKSRQEKKVKEVLDRMGYEVFLPLQKVMRQWSDRKKRVEIPLFNSYIFARTSEVGMQQILQVPGIAWLIRYNGLPAVLHQREYDQIVRFMDTGLLIESLTTDQLEIGELVRVLDGPLKGMVGQVSTSTKSKFAVVLEGLGQAIRVDIDPGLLMRVD